jgi:A/G-specific adenine glycosylase
VLDHPEAFAKALLKWYRTQRRDLPWRPPMGSRPEVRPEAYRVVLSEFMLQQTQVATVIPYFHRFLERFPTVHHLAEADEQEVLRLWQGLGYYSRARNLHKAAKAIVRDHQGRVPDTVDELLKLPGIGRYTAGAIASLAHHVRAPIVDGNVQRVICRLDAKTEDPREGKVAQEIWRRAEELLPAKHPGDFNSALMELGATICTPRNPQCLVCPVREFCEAASKGIQEQIPLARKAIERPLEKRWVFCIEHDGRWLIEQRPPTGRWAGMWQFVTTPRGKGKPAVDEAGKLCGVTIESLSKLGLVTHGLTHRRYEFIAWQCRTSQRLQPRPGRAWVTLEGLAHYPLSKPQLAIARLLAEGDLPASA